MNDTAGFGADEGVPWPLLALLFKQFSNLAGEREPSREAYPLAGVVLPPACAAIVTYGDFDTIAVSGKHHLALPRMVPLVHLGVPRERWPRPLAPCFR